jgi:hypothetical protein
VGNTPDLITANLAALHFYQLALPAPTPREEASTRTPRFEVKVCENNGRCATWHVPQLYTEPGWTLHSAKRDRH